MTGGGTPSAVTVGQYLASQQWGELEAPKHLWGFGGLNGGLLLAVLAERAQRSAEEMPLRSVSGRFHRAVRSACTIETTELKGRGSVRSYAAQAVADGGILADATVVLGAQQSQGFPARAAPSPEAPVPARSPVFPVPRDFVPASSQVEIRLAAPQRPYGGHAEATLLAWLRITTDDLAPDAQRLLFLLDMIAPSYAALLEAPAPIPTVELSVQFTGALRADASPWVLVSARTRHAPGDGWVVEDFDAWSERGDHLATARQVRVIRD